MVLCACCLLPVCSGVLRSALGQQEQAGGPGAAAGRQRLARVRDAGLCRLPPHPHLGFRQRAGWWWRAGWGGRGCTAAWAARVRIVWPSLGTTIANMADRTEAGLAWWADDHGQPMGPGEQWEGLQSLDNHGERRVSKQVILSSELAYYLTACLRREAAVDGA